MASVGAHWHEGWGPSSQPNAPPVSGTVYYPHTEYRYLAKRLQYKG